MASLGDLFVVVGAKIDGFKQAMTDVSSTLDGTATKATASATIVQKAFAGIGFAAAIGAGALAAADKFDQASVAIQNATGATGEKLKGYENSFRSVYKTVDESSQQVSTTLSLLATRTGLTGTALEDVTRKTLNLAKTQREDVTTLVPLVTRMFGDWSIATNKTGTSMDFLRVVSQQTGSKVADITQLLVYAGAPLRQLGYDFDHAATLIGKFQKEGVNTELVLGAMKAILGKFAKEGITDTAAAWQDFIGKVQKGNVTLADIAQTAGEFGVGRRAAVDLYRAIVEGRFAIDETTASIHKLAESSTENVETMRGKFLIFTHQVEDLTAAHKDLIVTIGLITPGIMAVSKVAGPAIAGFIASLTGSGGATAALTTVTTYSQKCAGQIAAAGGIAAAGWGLVATGILAAAGAVAYAVATRPKTGKVAGFVPGMSAENLPPMPRGAPAAPAFAFEVPTLKQSTPDPTGVGLTGGTLQPGDKTHPWDQVTDSLAVLIAAYHDTQAAHKATIEEIAKSGLTIPAYWDDLKNKAAMSALAFDDLGNAIAPQKSIFEALGPSIATCDKLMKELGSDVTTAAAEALRTSPYGQLTESAKYFGITTRGEYEKTAKESQTRYQEMKDSGLASDRELTIAYLDMLTSMADADRAFGRINDQEWQKITTDVKAQLDKVTGAHKTSANTRRATERTLGEDIQAINRKTFDSIERGLADSVVNFKTFGKTLGALWTTIWQGLAKDALSIMFKTLLDPLEKAIGKVLGGIFGGGASAAGTAVGGIGGGGGGAAGAVAGGAGGAVGIISAVTGAVTAISSVVGNFQMAGMNKSLDLIENYTRYLKIGLVEQGDSLLNDSHVIRNTLTDFMAWNWNVATTYFQGMSMNLDRIAAAAGGGGGVQITIHATGVATDTVDTLATEMVRRIRQSDVRRKF